MLFTGNSNSNSLFMHVIDPIPETDREGGREGERKQKYKKGVKLVVFVVIINITVTNHT